MAFLLFRFKYIEGFMAEEKIKGKKIIPKNEKQDEMFFCEVFYDVPTQEEIDKVSKDFTKAFFPILKQKVKIQVPQLLEPANFYGEAEEYMFRNKIRFSKTRRAEFAKAIYDDFIKTLDDILILDEQDATICISPYVLALEFGDFYRPGVNLISKILEEYFNEIFED